MGSNIIVNNYGSFDVTFKSGKGATLTDVNGKKYIDFLAGIAVNCLGHNYKPLVKQSPGRQRRKSMSATISQATQGTSMPRSF